MVEVQNWGSHDLIGPFASNDPGLAKQIRRTFGLHPMGFEVPVRKTAAQLNKILGRIVDGVAVRTRLTLKLMREQAWDVFLVAFGETHRAGHMLWPDPDDPTDKAPVGGVAKAYAAVDQAIGEIVREAGPQTDIVLFALHGMGANSSQSHLASIFMRRAMARFRGEPAATEAGEAPGFVRTLRRKVPPACSTSSPSSSPNGSATPWSPAKSAAAIIGKPPRASCWPATWPPICASTSRGARPRACCSPKTRPS